MTINISPFCSAPKLNLSFARKVRVNSMPLNVMKKTKCKMHNCKIAGSLIWRRLKIGYLERWVFAGSDGLSSFIEALGRVSWNLLCICHKFSSASPQEMIAGNENGLRPKLVQSLLIVADNPPIAGPIMNPKPKAMPTRAMPLERFSRLVMSATAAVATARLPLAIPAMIRDRNNNQRFPANIHIK